jgi:hypothetical protein
MVLDYARVVAVMEGAEVVDDCVEVIGKSNGFRVKGSLVR